MQNSSYIDLFRILINIYDSKLLKKNEVDVSNIINRIDKELINKLLFIDLDEGTKKVDNKTLNFLRDCEYDMKDICFDDSDVSSCNFKGLKNVVIDIDKIVNKDLSNTILDGVKLLGSLDNAIISGAFFDGYIGDLVLDPQKLASKDLSMVSLNGITVNGSFDGCDIFSINFEGAKGDIYINPQKVFNRDLRHAKFNGVTFIGDKGKEASFKKCSIKQTSFEGAKGDIYIDPQELMGDYIMLCKFSGVTFTGGFDNITLVGNDFVGSKNAVVDLNKVSEPQIITNGNLKGVTVIPMHNKTKKKKKVN